MAQTDNNHGDYRKATPKKMHVVFGVFMILIYIGMGTLMFTPFFEPVIQYSWIRIVLGCAFIIYGIFRAYREFSYKN